MELFDVYDKHGKRTGKMKVRGETLNEGEYIHGVSLWIANNEGKLLLQKRAAVKSFAAGKWAVTGGVLDVGETSKQGCVREVKEELGLEIDAKHIALLHCYSGNNIIDDIYITTCDFSLSAVVLREEEVAEVKWASVDEIKQICIEGQFIVEEITYLEDIEKYLMNRMC